ncbi:MAG: hypothetical protein U0931_29450 [Vulcanimicrobiota bacterium]
MKFQSQPYANLALNLVLTFLGGGIMWAARDFSHADSNARAGFLLGVLLAVIGVLALIVDESRRVEWDENQILLDVRRRVGGNRQLQIPLREVGSVTLGAQGKSSSGTRYYDLVVKLNSGREIPLFGGCAVEGRMNRSQVEQWRQRLESAVQKAKTTA